MFPLIGAAGSALSILSSLLQSSAASNTKSISNNPLSSLEQTLTGGSGQQTQAVAGSGQGAAPFSSGTLATLIALQGQGVQGQSGANGRGGLFSQLDADGDGKISKTDFETALGKAGVDASSADSLFSKLDANGDGSVSQGELAKARGGHHHHHAGGKGGLSSLLNSTDAVGASTSTAANTDGSSTTTITYADGSAVSLTTPAAAQDGGTSGGNTRTSNQANLLEQLIKLQSQITAKASTSTASSAIA